MAGTIENLKTWLTKNKTFTKKVFADLDCDAVLDERDGPPFDDEWVRVDKVVTKKSSRLNAHQWKLIDEIRQMAFMQTAKFVGGGHELCGYVSDDFGLIATALAMGHEDAWLNALWSSYKQGKIPCGVLEPIKGSLSALI